MKGEMLTVTETLVVDHTDVDVCVQFLACDARVHGLVAVVVVACFFKLVPEVVDGCVLLVEAEGR